MWDKITTMLWHDKREREFVVCNRFMWAITFGWWPRYLAKKSSREWGKHILGTIEHIHNSKEWRAYLADDSPAMVIKYVSEGSMSGPVVSAEVIMDDSGKLKFKKKETK